MKPCDYKKEEETNLFGLILIGVVSFFTIPTRWFMCIVEYYMARWKIRKFKCPVCGGRLRYRFDLSMPDQSSCIKCKRCASGFDFGFVEKEQGKPTTWERHEKLEKDKRGDNADTP